MGNVRHSPHALSAKLLPAVAAAPALKSCLLHKVVLVQQSSALAATVAAARKVAEHVRARLRSMMARSDT